MRAGLALGDRQHRVGRLHEEERRLAAGVAHLAAHARRSCGRRSRCGAPGSCAAAPATGTMARAGGCEDVAHRWCFRWQTARIMPCGDHAAATVLPCADPTLAAMFTPRSIKHCRACGGEVALPACPPTTTAIAPPAPSARTIHYENPLNVVGTLPVGKTRCCSAGATSSRATACGRCRPASWSSARRPREGALRETDRGGRRAGRDAGPVHR